MFYDTCNQRYFFIEYMIKCYSLNGIENSLYNQLLAHESAHR